MCIHICKDECNNQSPLTGILILRPQLCEKCIAEFATKLGYDYEKHKTDKRLPGWIYCQDFIINGIHRKYSGKSMVAEGTKKGSKRSLSHFAKVRYLDVIGE